MRQQLRRRVGLKRHDVVHQTRCNRPVLLRPEDLRFSEEVPRHGTNASGEQF
jgi:hypothetical protein